MQEMVLSFYRRGPGARTQVIWLSSKCLYPLIHLTSPGIYFSEKVKKILLKFIHIELKILYYSRVYVRAELIE